MRLPSCLKRLCATLILEPQDDPYYYLYDQPVPSYFALERTLSDVGRVIRLDSLSKVMSSGMRLGFASGPEVILNAMDVHVRSNTSFTAFLFIICVFLECHNESTTVEFTANRRVACVEGMGV